MLTPQQLVEQAKQHIQEIAISQAEKHLGDYQIIDVREPAEYGEGHLPNAINIPRGVLEFNIENHITEKATPILVYCKTGGRASLSAQALQTLGYTAVKSLAGGYEAWAGQNLPMVK